MFALAGRLIVGAVAGAVAASVATAVVERAVERKQAKTSNECQLCEQNLSGEVRSMTCCGQKFHKDCLRAYVQSLDGCPIKCPNKNCGKIVTLDEKGRRDYEVPIPTERIYFCHHCAKIVTNTKPRVLPCTHRFCVECIRQCMVAKVAMMGEEARCPMEACGQPISDELHDSIIRLE